MIAAELFKHGSDIVTEKLSGIGMLIWNTGIKPPEWSKGVIVKIPKKGSLRNCDKWRGITLLSLARKITCWIMLKILQSDIDKKLRKIQASFRQGCSCNEQIFTLRIIIEQSLEFNKCDMLGHTCNIK